MILIRNLEIGDTVKYIGYSTNELTRGLLYKIIDIRQNFIEVVGDDGICSEISVLFIYDSPSNRSKVIDEILR